MWRCDTAFTVGETSWHKIQWGAVYCSASRRGRVFRGWKGAAERAGSVLYEKCKDDFEWLKEAGYTVSGGVNAPYIWLKTPDQMTSWEFFDYLLENAGIVGTPGSGFGPSGEGYFRLTAFGTYENTVAAIERIQKL